MGRDVAWNNHRDAARDLGGVLGGSQISGVKRREVGSDGSGKWSLAFKRQSLEVRVRGAVERGFW